MSLQSISLVLACAGTILALANQVQRWREKRAAGTIEEHRLDIDGLQMLAKELRTELDRTRQELDRERSERTADRARIIDLEGKVDQLTRELRKAHDTIDHIRIEREVRRP